METSLETVLGDAGVDPATCAALITDGWTIASFREVVDSSHEFSEALFEELCPGVALTPPTLSHQERLACLATRSTI